MLNNMQEKEENLTVFESEYSCMQNNSEAVKWVVSKLLNSGSVIFAWTDGEGTQLDLLLTYKPFYDTDNKRLLQGGIRAESDLFVSIVRHGAFGFDIRKDSDTHPNYYAEKLGVYLPAFADFINKIRASLA